MSRTGAGARSEAVSDDGKSPVTTGDPGFRGRLRTSSAREVRGVYAWMPGLFGLGDRLVVRRRREDSWRAEDQLLLRDRHRDVLRRSCSTAFPRAVGRAGGAHRDCDRRCLRGITAWSSAPAGERMACGTPRRDRPPLRPRRRARAPPGHRSAPMTDLIKITGVETLDGRWLRLRFSDGAVKDVDLSGLLSRGGVFARIRDDRSVFEQV